MTMAAHASTSVPRSSGLLTRLKAFIGRVELDRRLAAGTDPAASPELARRAQVLSRWRVQHALADALERVVVDAIAPPRPHGAAIPVQREEVLAAQRDLLRLAAALRAVPGPPVRATAAASLLVEDGSSPIFTPHPPGTLGAVAFQAAFHAEAG
jgi:hypothetical protein